MEIEKQKLTKRTYKVFIEGQLINLCIPNEEAIELTDKERGKLLKEMIGIETDTEEKWICDMCKREQSPKKKQHLFLQHGILCSNCFDIAI